MKNWANFRRILWASTSSWLQQGIGIFTSFFVARLLSPHAFGLVAIAMLFILISQRLIIESVGQTLIRIKDLNDEISNAGFAVSLLAGLVFGSLLFLASTPVAYAVGMPEVEPILKVLSIIPVIDGLSCVQTALLRRKGHYRLLAQRTGIANLVGMAIAIGLALSGFGVWSLVFQQIGLSAVSAGTLWTVGGWRPTTVGSTKNIKFVLRAGVPMAANSLANVAINRADQAVVALCGEASIVGFYTLAKRTSRLIIDGIVTGISSVALSSVAQEPDQALRQNHVLTYLRYTGVISFPIFIGLSFVSKEFVLICLGEKWIGASEVLSILSLAGIGQSMVLLVSNILVAYGETRKVLFSNLISFAFFNSALVVVLQEFNVEKLAFAVVFQSILSAALMMICLVKAADLNLRRLFESLLPSFCGCVVLILAVKVGVYFNFSIKNAYYLMGFKFIVGFVFYIGAISFILKDDLLKLVGSVRANRGW